MSVGAVVDRPVPHGRPVMESQEAQNRAYEQGRRHQRVIDSKSLLSDDMVELVAQTISDMTGVPHVGPGEHWAFADARAILEAIVAAKEGSDDIHKMRSTSNTTCPALGMVAVKEKT